MWSTLWEAEGLKKSQTRFSKTTKPQKPQSTHSAALILGKSRLFYIQQMNRSQAILDPLSGTPKLLNLISGSVGVQTAPPYMLSILLYFTRSIRLNQSSSFHELSWKAQRARKWKRCVHSQPAQNVNTQRWMSPLVFGQYNATPTWSSQQPIRSVQHPIFHTC